jgi:hypothetical protein
MQLILCNGSSNQVIHGYTKYYSMIDKNKSILYIPLAWEKGDYDSCLEWLKSELTPYVINKYEMINDVSQFDNINLEN